MKRPIGISDAQYTANLEAEVERLAKEREEYRQQSIRHTILTGEVVQKLDYANLQIRDLKKKIALMVIGNGGAITVKDRDVISFDPDRVTLEEFRFGPDYVIRVQSDPRVCVCGSQPTSCQAHPVTEKRLGSSPTERPCCVEAYARGYAVGKEHRS